jgi:hypothetical protein
VAAQENIVHYHTTKKVCIIHLSELSATLFRYRLRFDSPQWKRIFPLTFVFRPALGSTQPPVQWVPGSFPGGKARTRSDADHSPPSSAEVVNEYSYIPSPPPPPRRHMCVVGLFTFTYEELAVGPRMLHVDIRWRWYVSFSKRVALPPVMASGTVFVVRL